MDKLQETQQINEKIVQGYSNGYVKIGNTFKGTERVKISSVKLLCELRNQVLVWPKVEN